MERKKRLAGRFLPSRVYARWKWTVRFGLSALPLMLLLAGCIVIYLTPSRYQSSIVFEYLGKRPPADVAALLKTNQVIDRAVKELELSKLMEISSETANEMVEDNMRVKVEPGTGFIELKVTDTRKEVARDLAAQMVDALEKHENFIATSAIELRKNELRQASRDAEDHAEEKLTDLTRLMKLNDGAEMDTLTQLAIDAARTDWEAAREQIREFQNQSARAERELANPGKWVAIMSQPSISYSAVKPKTSFDDIIFRSLGIGLCFALLCPYLLELAFPQIYRPRPLKREEWEKEMAEAGFSEVPV